MNRTQLLELLDRILRSWWTVVAGICAGLLVGMVAMNYLPKTFEASTTIFVIPRQVPERLVPGTVTDNMSVRLGALREALLSRPYMNNLIEEIYGTIEDNTTTEHLIRSIQRRLEISLIRIDPRRGGGIFQLTFQDTDGQRGADTVNKLAKLYIDQNTHFRTAQAQGTTDTMLALLQEAESSLRVKEQELADFRKRHLYDTSEHYNANLQQLLASREELDNNNRMLSEERNQLQTLLLQQEQAARLHMEPGVIGSDPTQAELLRLRRELDDLTSRYHDDHPAVQKARKQLDRFIENNALVMSEDSDGTDSGTSPRSMTDLQIASTREEILRLEPESVRIRQDIAKYKKRLENSPKVDQELAEYTKDYDVVRENYQSRLQKYEEANAALRVEQAAQGERFEIVEEARKSILPVKPVPVVVYGASLIAGLVLFLGPLVMRFFLSPKVLSVNGFRELSEFPVLASITRLATPEITALRRKRKIKNVLASLISVVLLAVVFVLFR